MGEGLGVKVRSVGMGKGLRGVGGMGERVWEPP